MFRKRIPLNKKEPSSDLPDSSDNSTFSDNHAPGYSLNPNFISNPYEPTNFSSSDTNVSFRRGLRDGTITNTLNLSQNNDSTYSKKHIPNLSFTDSIIENDFDRIHFTNSIMNRSFPKKRYRKGLDLTNTKRSAPYTSDNKSNPQSSPNLSRESFKFEDETMDDHAAEYEVEFSDNVSELSEDLNHEGNNIDIKIDDGPSSYTYEDDVGLYDISDFEEDFDIELEISQIIQNVEDELYILNKNLKSTNNLLNQNNDKMMKLDMEQMELVNQINIYFGILETSRTLFSLVESKLPELSKCLDKIKSNRIEETEYLLRMRRWVYCDLLRLSGVIGLNYRCGDLEDIDEMGKDLSITIERTFENRVEGLQKIKEDLVNNSLNHSNKHKYKDLGSYLVNDVRDLFTLKLGFNYSLKQLSDLYEYEISLEETNVDLMADVTEEYSSISKSLEPFRKYKNDFELLKSFKFGQNFKDIFMFYAKVSILTWNPLIKPSVETLEWFRVVNEFDPNFVCVIVDEVLYLLALNCIEYFDIESYEQCNNLSQFLKFVLQNSSSNGRSLIVEKITSTLIKSLQTKVSVITFGINFQDSFEPSSLIADPVINHILKFGYLNLISNIMCFSDILSNATIATVVVDDLFINKTLPILDFESPLDAFLVLNFKKITAPLSKHFQIKTKNNSIVKLTLSRFSESKCGSRSKADIFNSLSVPMDTKQYTKLLNL